MADKQQLLLLPGLPCDRVLCKVQIDRLLAVVDIFVGDMLTAENMTDPASDLFFSAPRRFALAGLPMRGCCAFEIVAGGSER